MKPSIVKSFAVVAISLASVPAFAMDSLVIERFYIQNKEPLNASHKVADYPGLLRVSEGDKDSEGIRKNMRGNENAYHGNIPYLQRARAVGNLREDAE
ncbi:hypothetical protein KGQ90_11860 [Modicisalibacter tunisiensis]|uniref:hypothetical protein n=1 Tax=Modicisalibacter tunisiensis TaxID=390637 RepID=UPI001CC995E9|nr:hypothetical protein [Modicisalibacter tunisiensis]MBZ9539623.1 hypothetical protein [Modicisalibacter tunisiensis]